MGGEILVTQQPKRSLAETLRKWWRQLWLKNSSSDKNYSSPPNQNEASSQHHSSSQPRYEVMDKSGAATSQHDALSDAHKAWKEQTGSAGRIIDRQTGKDITP